VTRREQSCSKSSHDAESVILSSSTYHCYNCERLAVMSADDVAEWIGQSKRNVYRLMSQHRFPRPIRVGARKVVWVEREINEWLKEQMRNRA
jgi:prophage regulatory protein